MSRSGLPLSEIPSSRSSELADHDAERRRAETIERRTESRQAVKGVGRPRCWAEESRKHRAEERISPGCAFFAKFRINGRSPARFAGPHRFKIFSNPQSLLATPR